MLTAIQPNIKALIAKDLLGHSDMDVNISIASCLSEITRIIGPDVPYDDDIMKEIFWLTVGALKNLDEMSNTFLACLTCVKGVSDVYRVKYVSDTSRLFAVENNILHRAKKLDEKALVNCSLKLKSYLAKLFNDNGALLSDYNKIVAVLVLLGDSGVGKSCIVLRFVRGQFDPTSKVTVGASFLSQTIALQDSTTVKFEIWDTAGQERYAALAPLYYRGAAVAVVVYDITSPDSFLKAQYWVKCPFPLLPSLEGLDACNPKGVAVQKNFSSRNSCSAAQKSSSCRPNSPNRIQFGGWNCEEFLNENLRELQKHGSPDIVMALVGNKADLHENRRVSAEEAVEYAEKNGMFFIETSAKTADNINQLFEFGFSSLIVRVLCTSVRVLVLCIVVQVRYSLLSRSCVLQCKFRQHPGISPVWGKCRELGLPTTLQERVW
ncbi:hypothetical protein IEQ34_007795 [Dendrobium chrysotoxum]|uniref:Uncharacterized protein n=1 Tax=Dendrobium chrysotoxum TaxID=161865 RepID=A0AAV7H5E8_DENCH|nr:hypothetical protein IEQ34_007795 [Dendrobium chrysotoxum]